MKSFNEAVIKANKELQKIRDEHPEKIILVKEGNRTYGITKSEYLKSKQQLEKYQFRLDVFCLPIIGALFILMLLVWLI